MSHKNNSTDKAKRAIIAIAGIEVEVIQLPVDEYVMSQSQMATAVDKDESHSRRFLAKKGLKSLSSNGFTAGVSRINRDDASVSGSSSFIPVSISNASEYWTDCAFKGNVKAQALMVACLQETLQRRCDAAFTVTKTEQQYEQQAIVNRESWEQSRQFLKDAHASFTNCCIAYGFHAGKAHDAITKAVCNKTAAELRELEVINGSSSVGLNHIQDIEHLVKIAKVKIEFSRYRKGTIDERVLKALKNISK